MMNKLTEALRAFKQAPVTWLLTLMMVGLFLIELVLSKSIHIQTTVLYEMGGAFGPSILQGDYWRLLTAGFLHGSILHLLCNLVIFVWIGKMLERLLGGLSLLVLFLNSILSGNLLALWLSPLVTLNIGASGGIFGLMASFIIFGLLAKQPELWQEQAKSMVGFIVLSIILSVMTPNVSVWGHIGGFIGGSLLTTGVMWQRSLRALFKINALKISLSWVVTLLWYVLSVSLIWQRFGG